MFIRLAAELLDPRVLVGRNHLRSKLAADPIGFFGHDDAHAVTQGCDRGRDASGPAAENGNIALQLPGGGAGGQTGQQETSAVQHIVIMAYDPIAG